MIHGLKKKNTRPSFSHGYPERIGNDTSIVVHVEVCTQLTEYKVQIVSKPVHQLDNCITWTIVTRIPLAMYSMQLVQLEHGGTCRLCYKEETVRLKRTN